MIYVKHEDNEFVIEEMLIVTPETTAMNMRGVDFAKLERMAVHRNHFLTETTWIRPNRLHKALMRLRLIPKTPFILKVVEE